MTHVVVQKNGVSVIVERIEPRVVVERTTAPVVPVVQRHHVHRPACRTRVAEVVHEGPQGPPGQDGDKHYKHLQSSAADTWVVDHGLNKYPSVIVIDSGGTAVSGSLEYINENQLVLRFTAAFGGVAYCN